MPPKFSLQTILDYRHNRVEILETTLGRLIHNYQQELDRLAQLFAAQERLFKEVSEFQTGEIDMLALTQARFNIRRLHLNIEQQQDALKKLEAEIESMRQVLILAKQDESVLANLSEKELERYFEKMNGREKQLMDDINIAKAYARSSRN